MAVAGKGADKSSAPLSKGDDDVGGRRFLLSSSAAEIGLKKGPWTPAEDGILKDYVRKHGEGNWNAVQRSTGLSRCGKSCRLRWANHLRPNLRKGAFTPEEEMLILRLHSQIGNKWARMAAQLPGRTDNEIKNYWNTRIKRRQRAGLPLYPSEMHNRSSLLQTSAIMSSSPLSIYPSSFHRTGTIPSPTTPLALRPLPLSTTLSSAPNELKAKYMAYRPAPLLNATSFTSPTMTSGSMSLPGSQFSNHINFQFPLLPVSSMSPMLSPTRTSLAPLLHQQMQFGLGNYNTNQPLVSSIFPKFELSSTQLHTELISSKNCSKSRPSSSIGSNVMLLQESQLAAHNEFKVEDSLFDSTVEGKTMKFEYSMDNDLQTDGFHFNIREELNNKSSDEDGNTLHDDLSAMFNMPVTSMSLNPDWFRGEDAEFSDGQSFIAKDDKIWS